MRFAHQWLASCLRLSLPRVLKAFGSRRPTAIFTDGAFDESRAGVGAVVFSLAELLDSTRLKFQQELWRFGVQTSNSQLHRLSSSQSQSQEWRRRTGFEKKPSFGSSTMRAQKPA